MFVLSQVACASVVAVFAPDLFPPRPENTMNCGADCIAKRQGGEQPRPQSVDALGTHQRALEISKRQHACQGCVRLCLREGVRSFPPSHPLDLSLVTALPASQALSRHVHDSCRSNMS